MGAVFMTCGFSAISECETKDLISLKASHSRTFTAPSIIKPTTTITATPSRTGAHLRESSSSLSDSNEPLTLPLPPIPFPTPALLPTSPPAPMPAPVSVSSTTTDVSVPLTSQRGSLAVSEVNQVLSNVAEGSDEDEVLETNVPMDVPSTSQSDGNLCVRARQVVLLEKEEQQKKEQQDHSHHHHHHHHRHNHSYHGQQQQQQQCCGARFGSGDGSGSGSGSGSGKHRLHSNSCVIV